MTWTAAEYMQWIKDLNLSWCKMEFPEADIIALKKENTMATIHCYPQDIIELSIVDEKSKPVFYLHFQAESEEHDKELTQEMLDVFRSRKGHHTLRILLSCTSALTTSYFAQELNSAAEILKMEYEFNAVPFNEIYQTGFDYDVILLAPQIGYAYQKVKRNLPGSVGTEDSR